MKILIFGTGKFYQERKRQIPPNVEVVAFLDNNPAIQGKFIDGRPVIAPCRVGEIDYDKILIMSMSENAMKSQLVELGVERKNILFWEQTYGAANQGIFKLYCGNSNIAEFKKKILIISTNLDYNGGTIAAFYAAKVLQERGNYVVLAAPDGNQIFINEVLECGINIVICPALTCMGREVLLWVKQFEVVLVNVFQMALCALEIIEVKPVLWWLHEPKEFYEKTITRFHDLMSKERLEAIDIYAVSDVAQRNFNFYFPDQMIGVLPYGIPDQKSGKVNSEEGKLVFAIIGAVCPIKAQDIFIKAVRLLKADERRNMQFWIIGYVGEDAYSIRVKEAALGDESIKIIGKLSRSEIQDAYGEIDVVVCPSLEDSLPIVVAEGMMHEKVCIVSDKTGCAKYVKNREDGLICRAGIPEDLCEQMKWIIQNRGQMPEIGRRARQLYKQKFSLDKMGENLEAALQKTMDNWNYNHCL